MEKARQAGKQIGVLHVEEREGFAEKFTPVLAQLEQKVITRKQASKELGISGPTLKRVLDNHLAATHRTFAVNKERNTAAA
jgi:DNA invertase Pin-like site-specific DNA recombinase